MINTLFASGLLNTPLGFAAALALGLCFGQCLERAGLGSSRRLAAVFTFQDMTVVKVMFTAMVTAMLGLVAAGQLGIISLDSIHLLPTLLGAHAVGGAVFGLGFAMAGWCPGTAAVGLGSGRVDALIYLLGLLIGCVVFNEVFHDIEPLTVLGDRGVVFLHQSLNVPRNPVVYAFVGAAVLFFWLSEMIERGLTFSRPGVSLPSLAVFCVVLAAFAFVAVNLPRQTGGEVQTAGFGQTFRLETSGKSAPTPGEPQLLADIQAGKDHIEPEELAERLRAGDTTMLLADIRSPEEFTAFHLKGARNIPMADLPQALAPYKNQGVIVLYSNGMTHPAQARDALARMGFANVYILTGGLTGFFEHCLKPASLRDAPVTPEMAASITTWREFFLPEAMLKPVGPALLAMPAQLPGLAEPAWLAQNLGKPGLKVIDLRAQPQYNSGHIPGSLSLQLESLRGNIGGLPAMLLPAGMLTQHLAQMGIAPRDLVVIVPGESPIDATLLAMAFERVGHRRYVLLSGGMKAWNAASLPKDTALPVAAPMPQAATPSQDGFTVDGGFVLGSMKDGKTVIIDVRPADYYAGTKTDEARAGHIPGAINRPFSDDHVKDAQEIIRLKPLAELEKAYAALIPAKDQLVIVHCRTGHQASQTWWVLTRLLGYTNVKYYDAGWTEWSTHADWPVVVSPAKPQGKEEKKP